MNIEIKRFRNSVTQGGVKVLVDGKKLCEYYDKIEILHEGDTYYGDEIGGWASKTPDSEFFTYQNEYNPDIEARAAMLFAESLNHPKIYHKDTK